MGSTFHGYVSPCIPRRSHTPHPAPLSRRAAYVKTIVYISRELVEHEGLSIAYNRKQHDEKNEKRYLKLFDYA